MAAGEGELWDAEHTEGAQGPYQGALGRTRTEPVQVWMPDGTIRALPVYVGVDAEADPGLAALARAGTLHQVAEDVDLAIPFVYHARSRRLLLLVVPEGLRHRALALRAEHMALIAADAQYEVPAYVRDLEVVVGAHGLNQRLAGGSPALKLHAVALDPGQEREALAQRERELMRRERLVRAKEQALRGGGFVVRASVGAVDDSELEEVDELTDDVTEGELELEGAESPPALPDDEPEPTLDDADALDDAEEAPLEALEEVVDIDASESVEEAPDADGASSPLGPPLAFLEDHEVELWLSEHDGHVWLFVRHRPLPPRDHAPMELLLQLDPQAELPVALVTLVFDVDGSPEARRGAIDPGDAAQVRALALLAEHFEVELVSVAGPHDYEHWATLSAPREANARAVLNRLTRQVELDPERFAHTRELLLQAPPPWRELSHPFQPNGDQVAPQNATEAAVQLDELAAWLSPERRDRLRLLWSVPDQLIDEHCIRSLGAALDWGLSLSGPLSARAIVLGVAQDQRSLVERRIRGLCRASRAPDQAGVEEGVLRAQWSEALEEAAHLGVTLSDEARELARKHAGERAIVHANALSSAQSEQLNELREQALGTSRNLDALRELLARGSHPDLLAGCRFAAQLGPEQAGRLFAKVATRDDPAAVDALLSLLAPREELMVRVGAALSLAQRRAVHAIDDLALNLARSDAPAYRLFALALGRYGGGSFRAVTRALQAHHVDEQRAATVYALLCCHGARAQLRAKARSSDRHEAELAERALSLAQTCRASEHALMELEEGADLTVFCRIFDQSVGVVPA